MSTKEKFESLQHDNDILVEESTHQRQTIKDLRGKIPSTPHMVMRGILNTIIVLLSFPLLSLIVIGLYVGVCALQEYIQEDIQAEAEEEAQEEVLERISTHPKVRTIHFNEAITSQKLQKAGPSSKSYWAFHQPGTSFVEFDIALISSNTIASALLQIYRYGDAEPLYTPRVGTGSYSFLLQEGSYRFRLLRSSVNNPTTASTVTVHRLLREDR